MILVTTDFISGKELETIAMVKGSTVQCKNVGKDIMSGFKNLVGGEMRSYTEMMDEARAIATAGWWRRRSTWAPTASSASATVPLPSCRGPVRSWPTGRR